jgi:hypothetical protein
MLLNLAWKQGRVKQFRGTTANRRCPAAENRCNNPGSYAMIPPSITGEPIMTPKTLLIAVSLTLLPGLAMAKCSGYDQQAMSCAQGSVWDSAKQACTPIVSG